MRNQITRNITMRPEDFELLAKVSEADRRSKSNTLVIALKDYAKKLGVKDEE